MKQLPRYGYSADAYQIIGELGSLISAHRQQGHYPKSIAISKDAAACVNKSLRRIARDRHACITSYEHRGVGFSIYPTRSNTEQRI